MVKESEGDMSDAELRDMERRCHDGSAGLEEQVARLTGRLRVGTLTRERLDLAASCGHEAALLAGGAPAPPQDDGDLHGPTFDAAGRRSEPRFPRRLRWWAVGLRRWGPPAWARAVSTALAVSVETNPRLADHRVALGEVIAAIEAWGECPCDAHLEAARRGARALGPNDPAHHAARDAVGAIAAPLEPLRLGPFDDLDRMRHVGRAASLAGGLVSADEATLTLLVHDSGPRRLTTMGALHSALGTTPRRGHLDLPSAGQPFLDGESAAGEEVVRRRVQERLIAYALS